MHTAGNPTIEAVIVRLLMAMALGGLVGYEGHYHHRTIAIAGMAALTAGATSFLLLAQRLAITDATALSRGLETSVLVISLVGVGIVWTRGVSTQIISTVGVVWAMGAVGLMLATDIWWVGLLVGLATIAIIYVSERVRI